MKFERRQLNFCGEETRMTLIFTFLKTFLTPVILKTLHTGLHLYFYSTTFQMEIMFFCCFFFFNSARFSSQLQSRAILQRKILHQKSVHKNMNYCPLYNTTELVQISSNSTSYSTKTLFCICSTDPVMSLNAFCTIDIC